MVEQEIYFVKHNRLEKFSPLYFSLYKKIFGYNESKM